MTPYEKAALLKRLSQNLDAAKRKWRRISFSKHLAGNFNASVDHISRPALLFLLTRRDRPLELFECTRVGSLDYISFFPAVESIKQPHFLRAHAQLAVTGTASLFELSAIDDDDISANIVDQAQVAKLLGNACNARTINAEDACDLFLRQFQTSTGAAVLKHQKPRAKPLFDRVMSVASNLL